jgi:hypothetical protein
MKRRRTSALLGLAGLLAAGVLLALTLAASALAWSPSSLPPGWGVDHIIAANATSCPSAYRIRTTSPGVFSDPLCEDSPTYQHDFDAFVDAHYTAPTTQASTTAAVITEPPATTTDPAPAPAPQPVPTTTATTTVQGLTPAEQALQDQIDQLRAQLAALTDRVSAIEAYLAKGGFVTDTVSSALVAEISTTGS